VIYGRKIAFDLLRMETDFADGRRLPDCPACGSAAPTGASPATAPSDAATGATVTVPASATT
jgi:hypothetical protein